MYYNFIVRIVICTLFLFAGHLRAQPLELFFDRTSGEAFVTDNFVDGEWGITIRCVGHPHAQLVIYATQGRTLSGLFIL